MKSNVPCAEAEKKGREKKVVQLCAICRTEDGLQQFKDKLICSECIVAIKDVSSAR